MSIYGVLMALAFILAVWGPILLILGLATALRRIKRGDWS